MVSTVADVAQQIAGCLEGLDRLRGEAEARRLAFSLVEAFDRASDSERTAMVQKGPAYAGDARFDALLGALVEHVCARSLIAAPAWVNEPSRFLETWWFMSGLKSLHADALVH